MDLHGNTPQLAFDQALLHEVVAQSGPCSGYVRPTVRRALGLVAEACFKRLL